MLGHGGLIALNAPAHILGFPEIEAERFFTELERSPRTRKTHRRGVFSLEFGSDSDKFKSETVTVARSASSSEKPANSRGKPSGADKVRFIPNAQINANSRDRGLFRDERMDESLPLSKNHHHLNAHNKHELSFLQQPSASRPSSEERLWPPHPAAENAGQVTVGSRLEEPHFEAPPPLLARDSDGEDWRSLSRVLSTGQNFSSISNHDLMRIAELRFSTDMQEGDSGSQVALLQKALFWLGYLSKQSHITGYFGTETKQALSEFQEAHGVSRTGIWGALSKQALWHTISGEILHRVVDEKASKPEEALKADTAGKSDISMQAWQLWSPLKLADSITGGMPEGEWRLLSGIALVVAGILFGLTISKSSTRESRKGNSVKRRIIPSSEQENPTLPSQVDKLSEHSSGSNGAAAVDKISQLASKKPAYITDVETVGQVDSAHVQDKTMIRDPLPELKTGRRVQYTAASSTTYGLGKKAIYASGISSQKDTSSKSVESIKRGKQLESWGRPAGVLESSSSMAEDSRPEPLSSSRRGPARFQREGNEPSENTSLQVSVSRNTPTTSRRNTVARPSKNLYDESSFPKSEGISTMQGQDEPNIKKRIEELRKAVEAAEENGQAAVHALAEERKRSLELEGKIRRQRESAAALEEEVRGLKESHDALLESLRKKTGSSSATGGASLLYQTFNCNDDSCEAN